MSTTTVTRAAGGPDLEVFVPPVRASRPGRALARLRSPPGIYTVPLLLAVSWQLASWQDWISPALASSPVEIGRAAVSLWRQGLPGQIARPVVASQIVDNLLPASFTTK